MDDAGVQNVGPLKPTRNANLNQNASDARASRGDRVVNRPTKPFPLAGNIALSVKASACHDATEPTLRCSPRIYK
jgi:hypothetical protein